MLKTKEEIKKIEDRIDKLAKILNTLLMHYKATKEEGLMFNEMAGLNYKLGFQQALLKYSEEIEKEIEIIKEKISKNYIVWNSGKKDGSILKYTEEIMEFIEELLSKIKGKEKNE